MTEMTEKINPTGETPAPQNPLEKLLESSFLRRVPDLMQEGKSLDEAVKIAYETELLFLIEMQSVASRKNSHSFYPHSAQEEALSELIDQMSKNIWIGFNAESEEVG